MPVSKKLPVRYSDGNTSLSHQTPSRPFSSSSIHVPVNNVLITVLVDTGAAISLINADTLSRMKHSPVAPTSLKEVHTANSGFLALTGLVHLTVTINHMLTYVHAYVTTDLICPMILGRDWIQNNHVNLNFGTNSLSLYQGLASTPLLTNSPREPVVMSLSVPIVIPPFHQLFVYGRVSVPTLHNALFTPNLTLQHNRLLILPHALLNIDDHCGIISIINNTRRSKSLAANTPLGLISPSPSPSIHVISSTSVSPSSAPRPSDFSLCPHCQLSFSVDTMFYEHLLQCCNKDTSCSSAYLLSLISHLPDPMLQMKVYHMLHQYSPMFDNSSPDGINCPPQHAIHTDSHAPLAEHPRRLSPLNRQITQAEVTKLLKNDIISPSNSPWSSPVVIVRKPDGSPRFCIDYRRLNNITKKDVYPLPRIDDILERLHGSRLFSKLDLVNSYFQVPLTIDEREKTAFSTPDGHWQFNRLPQGLRNSPAVFQRLMNQTLGALRWEICLAYIDDVIIFSPTFDQHLIDVNRVCQVLHQSNFKLNAKKCSLFQHEISFLGHSITSDGCSPNLEKVRSILQFPIPRSSKAAHSFLQMVGFYRKFISGFSTISHPLNKFTRKNFPFVWTDVEQTAFDQLKAAITAPPVLLLPDPTQPYTIRTDASRVGIGAVLLQQSPLQPDDPSSLSLYRPVAFASRSLQPAERNYSTIELETLAIWWSVTDKFRSYIEGQSFVLETDHKPLMSLMKKPYHNTRIERWMTTLQQYDMTIRHIPGKENTTADALSRYPVDSPDEILDLSPRLVHSATQTDLPIVNAVITRSTARNHSPSPSPSTSSPSSSLQPTPVPPSPPIVSPDSFLLFDHTTLNQHQNQDPILSAIKHTLPLDPHYHLDDHQILYKRVFRKDGRILVLPYIPRSLIPSILSLYHNSAFQGAHFGIKRTFYKLRDRYFWPHMYVDVRTHVLSCLNCRKFKPSRHKPDGHLQPITPPTAIWERLAIDFVGPVPPSSSGNKYFLVLTDLFSKFVITKAVPDNTSITAASFLLNDVFLRYGTPLELISDNGVHFCSSLFDTLLRFTQCCHVKVTPYNPRANGQCERHNATLLPNLLALSNASRSDWDAKLLATTFNYNATQHSSTGYPPFELMFARSPRFVADLPSLASSSIPTTSQYHHIMSKFIEHAKIAARRNNIHHQQLAKQRFDHHRSNPCYIVGQSVLIRNRQSHLNKFSPKFVGPYVVVEQLHSNTYLVEHPGRQQRVRVPVQDLRPIHG